MDTLLETSFCASVQASISPLTFIALPFLSRVTLPLDLGK